MKKLIEGEKSLKEHIVFYNIVSKKLEELLAKEIIKQYEKI
jgi:hypothetical protein